MIKAVLFDVGGVLHESDTAVGDDLQQELGLTSIQIKEIWADQIFRMGKGKLDEPAFWEELKEKYDIRQVNPSEHLLSRAFARELKQNTRVLDIARNIDQAGLKTAVLSDTNALHAKVLENAGSYEPFKYRFLSHELGMRKPDPRIYKKALSVLEVRPEESIFIDDNSDNVVAAEKLGINGIVFKDTNQFVAELAALLPGVDLESK
jgi:putative hydrolase of the HAD superfamily